MYSAPYFNLGSLELSLGGLSPAKPPVATGLVGQSPLCCYIESLLSDCREALYEFCTDIPIVNIAKRMHDNITKSVFAYKVVLALHFRKLSKKVKALSSQRANGDHQKYFQLSCLLLHRIQKLRDTNWLLQAVRQCFTAGFNEIRWSVTRCR